MANTLDKVVITVKHHFQPEYYISDKEDLLGKGGYGSVYTGRAKKESLHAIHKHGLPEQVAVKVISWRKVDSSTNYNDTEIQLLRRDINFDHDNITRIYCVTFEVLKNNFKRQLIFMELCDETLDDYRKRETVSIDEIRYILENILKGLDHLHSQKIIHRDIKHQNVLL